MDELSLIIEGIDVKIKKLLIRNNQLKDKILHLEEEKISLLAELSTLSSRLRESEQELAEVNIAGVLKNGDPAQARQRINGILREIEKCQALLNR
jgi:chromosome segregation ATPase